MQTEQRDIFSVSRLNHEVKQTLRNRFQVLWVQGEVSNLAKPPSGHFYFSLKDEQAQVRCAMFLSHLRRLNFDLRDGMLVLAYVRVDLYTVRGEFQLVVETLEEVGTGNLKKRFEALKRMLEKEGLFDADRKRRIPAFPHTVGIIAAAKSAALFDILRIRRQRRALCDTIIYPALVQGQDAPARICAALDTANRRREADVLIIARGGGSFEDLQAFNDELVVRAVANSSLPTVSGIGHDIDFTLTDFAADLHAPTPTAAAMHVYPDADNLMRQLKTWQQHLAGNLLRQLNVQRMQLALRKSQLVRFHPQTQIMHQMQRLGEASDKLITAILTAISESQSNIEKQGRRLNVLVQNILTHYSSALERYRIKLNAISPYATLKRGYSITTDESGEVIRAPGQTAVDAVLLIRVEKGSIIAVVRNTHTGHEKNT